ncbi:ATP-binding protein [Spirillospora sp. NPDC048819]|uniref:ATP-binding protein n=1 Tax=Spirillospora sp. NPDC048819 TaxID=3155268 RepID=UPI003407DB51
MTKTAMACGIPWRLENGGCASLPLPGDESIAAMARRHVASLLPALGLSVRDVDDVTLMVSELATNVLQHATSQERSPGAELWVYQRGDGRGHDELVVKAFDTLREWRADGGARPDRAGEMLDHGRGLEIIDILAKGRWGYHPTRSRLSSPSVRGKATWFALPIPRTRIARGRRNGRAGDERQATKVLHSLLVQRGIDRFTPMEELGVCELSGHGDLKVWCEDAMFRWHARSGETGGLPVTDITEACEQIVRICESLDDVHVV